jgi:hypothetical protein
MVFSLEEVEVGSRNIRGAEPALQGKKGGADKRKAPVF